MKVLLKSEYAALLIFSIFLFSFLSYPWWVYLVLFLVPDIGMIGYLAGTCIGAWTYNAFHTLSTGVVLFIIGSYVHAPLLELAGVLIIGHIGFDRLLGYGLKYPDSFKHTHLGNL